MLIVTLPSSLNTPGSIAFPSGFTKDNSYISDAIVDVNGYMGNVAITSWVFIAWQNSTITYAVKDSGVYGKQMKIILKKYRT